MLFKDDGNPILVQEHVDKLKNLKETNEYESLSVITKHARQHWQYATPWKTIEPTVEGEVTKP